MKAGAPSRVLGLPLDRLLALYLAVAACALAFPARPDHWPVLLLLHAAVIPVAWPPSSLRAWADRLAPRARARLRSTLDWAPLLIMPALYTELAVLNRAAHEGRYFDDLVIAWEQALFRGQPSREWAAALPELWISEPLHFAYISYYFIIFVPALLIFLRGSRAEFRTAVFTLMFAFFVHYVFFIYFPVQGPRYLFAPPGGELASGTFYQLAHRVLEAGSAQGAAFPSSHVGVSVVQTFITARYLPRLAPLVGLLTIGLAVGAVYGGFHYATDAIAGFLLGGAAFVAAPAVRSWLDPDPSEAP